nr:immunoglobulin light chain junction region [Macaca mulatta]MPO04230.1 immunoglobulin light chain junction region [Macaca mulatta]MPO04460.1 immunoglobulin light chain junction region [Macaca mulatta]MPO04746.1 immunoglobulin light chain junction region [Macaca mulatta]MPO06556.1 immunoglobulin light chain junction region [Macaca mulatta]
CSAWDSSLNTHLF